MYFYSWTGKRQPILFLTIAELLIELDRNDKLPEFIEYRSRLETFTRADRSLSNHILFNQIIRRFSTKRSEKSHLRKFYDEIINLIREDKTNEEIIDHMTSHKDFTYLQPSESPYTGVFLTRYSTQVKSGRVIADLLPLAPKCEICQGLIPRQAISIDHVTRVADGGDSSMNNLQLTHPFFQLRNKRVTPTVITRYSAFLSLQAS